MRLNALFTILGQNLGLINDPMLLPRIKIQRTDGMMIFVKDDALWDVDGDLILTEEDRANTTSQ